MRFVILTFLIFFIPKILSGQTQVKRFISYDGIGDLKICQSIQNSTWKFVKDSTSSGIGFEFFGKYLMNLKGGIVLSQISLIDSTSIIQLSTSCKDFETYEGIKVGTPILYLLSKFPECYITKVKSDTPEIYFSLQKATRRIKFKIDSRVEKELSNLNLKENQKASEVSGLKETLTQLGDRAAVKEITVLLTSICQ